MIVGMHIDAVRKGVVSVKDVHEAYRIADWMREVIDKDKQEVRVRAGEHTTSIFVWTKQKPFLG